MPTEPLPAPPVVVDRPASPDDAALIAPDDLARLLRGEHDDPFAVLGIHAESSARDVVVRCLLPGAARVELIDAASARTLATLSPVGSGELHAIRLPAPGPLRYRLRAHYADTVRDLDDPYACTPWLGSLDCHLLARGEHRDAYRRLGAHPCVHDGLEGTAFALWAPNASCVSVVGSFNGWDARVHAMRKRIECGVWELFVPGVGCGALYKFALRTRDGDRLLKADPYARRTEAPPRTASRICAPSAFGWRDDAWMRERAAAQSAHAPIAIYEVHLDSWRRHPDGRAYSYDELADALIPYVAALGFTHVELLPIAEYPFAGSWGYQPVSLFAPSARWGEPDALRRFVERCHLAGLGVLLDWVPAHFPQDAHGLARFDGTHLYEHEDRRVGLHRGWNTLVYNLGRHEVANFLIANALYWLREFHFDGLRVDAVASMLYLDYDRDDGQWLPNVHGGRENLEAVAFLRRLNETVHADAPQGAITIAEESTAWPMVSAPVAAGGLGFDFKWNMGWMNDTLSFMRVDPIHRRFHLDRLTFGLLYAWSEQFVLALSHDEVVHAKGSLLAKMPGDAWQRHANLRLYLAFQYAHPGKKLLFMGSEFGQEREWNHDRELDWARLADPASAGVRRLVGDLNRLYRRRGCLHRRDADSRGFRWIDCADSHQTVIAWRRIGDAPDDFVVVVCNFTPQPRTGYRIGVPAAGFYRELLNSDAADYGGSGLGNLGGVSSEPVPMHGEPHSLSLLLPPLAALVFAAPGH